MIIMVSTKKPVCQWSVLILTRTVVKEKNPIIMARLTYSLILMGILQKNGHALLFQKNRTVAYVVLTTKGDSKKKRIVRKRQPDGIRYHITCSNLKYWFWWNLRRLSSVAFFSINLRCLSSFLQIMKIKGFKNYY